MLIHINRRSKYLGIAFLRYSLKSQTIWTLNEPFHFLIVTRCLLSDQRMLLDVVQSIA